MSRWILAMLCMVVSWIAAADATARVVSFSPQGEVKGVRQVVARFDSPMVPFGAPALLEPFEIACDAPGSGHWIDDRSWVYDFDRDLAAGVRCSFSLRPGVHDLAGTALPPAAFEFTTGGPTVLESVPWQGDESIDENQVFVLGLDAPATPASILRFAWCDVSGRQDRVPVRVVTGKDRETILASQRDFVDRVARRVLTDAEYATFAHDPRPDALPVVLVACRARLPNEAAVHLVWGAGISTPGGVASTGDQVLPFKVRPVFTAAFSCRRTSARSNCLPVLPMTVAFTAPVAVDVAGRVRLRGEDGKVYAPRFTDDERRSGFVESVTFPGPFPEAAAFTLSLPDGLVDDSGRPLANARRFPLTVRTDPAPPLVKFAARFGILELHADPALPLTVRNVEPSLSGQVASVTGAGDGKGLDARMLRVQSPKAVMHWLKRLDAGEARWTEGGYVSGSIFGPGDHTSSLTVPRPGGTADFGVVGIPFRAPGLYVVEVKSPKLGQALLKDGKPYYVSAGALVTNLAVHFKWGRESSLVWVTSLDRGQPVPRADVAVMDCSGKVLFGGRTDHSGIVRVPKSLPERSALPGCTAKWDRQLFVTARKGDDASFVLSDWNEGIATWRFNLRRAGFEGPDSFTTVFDRTLVRAGETVSMKHFVRRRTSRGFAFAPAADLPERALVRHVGTQQSWTLPLEWVNGSATSTFVVPKDAHLGEYEVLLGTPGKKGKSRPRGLPDRLSGSFRVQAFRVPVLKAQVQMPAQPLVGVDAVDVGVQLAYLSGGGAGGQNVKLRAITEPATVTFPDHEGVVFANGDVREGRRDGRTGLFVDENGEDRAEDGTPAGDVDAQSHSLPTQVVDLDTGGAGRARVSGWESSDRPRDLVAEMEYADPNGQILARSARATLWPSSILLGVKPADWALSKDRVRLHVIAVDTSGRPKAGVRVVVDLFERAAYSHRKRLVGGFYAYEYGDRIRRVGPFCEGETDAHGILSCEAPVSVSGNLIVRAATWDAEGRASVAHGEVWVAGSEDWWFDVANDDRMDVLPERKQYEPGETAVFQVRSPFRHGTALVTVEREGVIDGFVTTLSGKSPVVSVPVKGSYAPNAFVSVLAVRGRVAGVQPTALVDLGKPAFRLGIAEIRVGWRAHELHVKVGSDRSVYRVREKARVQVDVSRADGKALPKDAEIAVAAVDEGLLEMMPNTSWNLLEAMMQLRGIEVETATAAMQVVGKRHFGKKARPTGGGGGRQNARELFDTLLFWKARVKLDRHGHAVFDVPLNDSLTRFRIVAVASAGSGLFGTGSTTVRTTQDVQLLSGLPPVVRERDRFTARFTVRNASDAPASLDLTASVVPAPAGLPGAPALASRSVTLQPGESRVVSWDVTAPEGATSLAWTVAATSGGNGAGDRMRVAQKVVEALPVRVLQATLRQLDGPVAMTVTRPAGAVPGRGGVSLQVRPRLADGLAGVRDYMQAYPYDCLEQRVSKAVALHDDAAWGGVMEALPTYLDRDGLAKYFPSMGQGSDTLTAYLLAIAQASGHRIPEPQLGRMLTGLRGFLAGTVVRYGSLPTADLAIRKVAALDALTRYDDGLDPGVVSSFRVEPDLWPTSTVIDWYGVARRWHGLPEREKRLEQAARILRARLEFRGTVMRFSTERSDYLWWLMVSGDVNANRALAALADDPQWRAELPRMARGALARQQAGRWSTTVANAWGTVALDRFSARFEREPVTGVTRASLGDATCRLDWRHDPAGGALDFAWPERGAPLEVVQDGTGRPWVTVQSRAAVPLEAPLANGYRVRRTVTAVTGDASRWTRGDVVRVRLDIEAQADMTWVVVDDPIPAGSTILGTGLGGDAALITADERSRGSAWPAFEERGATAFRAYYRFVPKGTLHVEYTLRLDNAGQFQLPATRVEAMYAPDVFGAVPNGRFVVAAQ
ncbi:MAG: alpha-2-macroglobulin [Betaproteobacteria bacterium]|nr:alpha-2-macroglobulin [Betaproteobacteria bacterium]